MYKDSESLGKPVTVNTLAAMKKDGEKIAMLTAYDSTFAFRVDEAGTDVVLVGDSLGMVVQGHETTVPVSVDDMIYHSAAVARGLRRALLLVDMPFMSYTTPAVAMENATRLMQRGGAQMVKLEGDRLQTGIVRFMAERGIPVCAHLGLKPQSVHKIGGYRVQGRDQESAARMLEDAVALEDAGADMLLLECVPAALAHSISEAVHVPVIGIGAGAGTDGQVLVLHDILGVTPGRRPKFSMDFMEGNGSIAAALQAYVHAVKDGSFPTDQQCFT